MLWFVLSLVTALAFALRAVAAKKVLRNVDEYIVVWAQSFFCLPFLILALFFVKIPKIDTTFWIALAAGLVLISIANVLQMRAIKVSPLSLTVPFMNFTPLFLLLTSPIMLGESPSFIGTIGIFLIVIGAYTLNIQTLHKGFFAPFKAIFKEKGSVLMLIVAIIFAVTSNIDKIGVLHSSPIFFAFIFHFIISLIFYPILIIKSKDRLKKIKTNFKGLFLVGFLLAVILLTQLYAITLTIVPYVIAVKRTSAIFSVIFGYLFFKEKNFKQCLVGAIIMVIGVVLIGLF